MLALSVPWWELIIRALATYVFMIVLLRIAGKRQVGQLAPFDLVLLLIISNAVQNSINGGDNSLIGGFISAAALVAANCTISYVTYRSKRIAGVVEGRPQVLIHNGKLCEDVMRKEKVTQHELDAAMRNAGVTRIDEIHYAILENNGQISIGSATPAHKATGCSPEKPL